MPPPTNVVDHNFLFASLESKHPISARRVHIRRLYDILQLSIHRQDYARARRAWAILTRCKEVSWKSLWPTGLLLVGNNEYSMDPNADKVDHLRSLMIEHPDDREAILTELIHVLIITGKWKEALDELDLYLPSYPFQDNAILHIYSGLMSLYSAQEASEDLARYSGLLREAKSQFEHANELDTDNIMAQAFVEKIATLEHESKRRGQFNDSDDEPMNVDEDTPPNPKRVRT